MAHINEDLFQKVKIVLLEAVVDHNYNTLNKHPHPGKLDIRIPIDKFKKDELHYLLENESVFKYQDIYDADVKVEVYPCYRIDTEFIYTNSINLLGFN